MTRDAFDFIKKKVKTSSASNEKYMEHLAAMLTREYIPGQNGAKIYFKACELDQHRARNIGVAEVLDTQIMVAAQIVFRREIGNNRIQEIDDKWNRPTPKHQSTSALRPSTHGLRSTTVNTLVNDT